MKLVLSWIRELVKVTTSPREIANTLSSLGIEVEKISNEIPSFSNVVVAKVLTVVPHPNARSLQVATVTDGLQEYQVVCGAPNCRPGIIGAFAPIGAKLKKDESEPYLIQHRVIRGVASEGMLCSGEELGLKGEKNEILEGDPSMPLGEDIAPFLTDPLFELSLTPNLGHCLSVIGIARELAAAYDLSICKREINLQVTGKESLEVKITDTKLVPRYACRILSGVSVAHSPHWMQQRLLACGIQPINNLIDIAHYVMLELGQPLHIFDLDSIAGKEIWVAPASGYNFSSVKTLDERERDIPPEAILIMDCEKVLAIGGIMGAASSAVHGLTTRILIEAASFNPVAIRKASQFLDLTTEAAYRFQRGVDEGEGLLRSIDWASQLIAEIAGGEIHHLVDHKDPKRAFVNPKLVRCRLSRLQQSLGFLLSGGEVVSLLERLDMTVNLVDEVLEVLVPTYRHDIEQEVDIIEEVVRLYGYSRIEYSEAPLYRNFPITESIVYSLEEEAREALLRQGLQECVTCDLVSPSAAMLYGSAREEELLIRVLHPRSMHQSVMRGSLLPGLLQIAKHNVNHRNLDLKFFEVGKIHFKEFSQHKMSIQEPSCAAILLSGKYLPHFFEGNSREADFFDLKGIVENFLELLRVNSYTFKPSHLESLHPWRQAQIEVDKKVIGFVGEVHPHLLQSYELVNRVWFAELNLNDLIGLPRKTESYLPLPVFPSSERDWTVSIKDTVSYSNLIEIIQAERPPLLDRFYLLDLYKPDSSEENSQNFTFRFIYRNESRTVFSTEIEKEHTRFIHCVVKKLESSV